MAAGSHHRVAERQVDDADVVARAVGDHPVDAGDDVARVAGAIRAEHAHVDQLHAGRDAAGIQAGRRVCSCPAMIPATCVPWPYASASDGSPVTKLTFATTLSCQRRVRRDARVDDRDADALRRSRREWRRCPAARRLPAQRLIGGRRHVRHRHRRAHDRVARQMIDDAVGGEPRELGAVRARAPRRRRAICRTGRRHDGCASACRSSLRAVHDDARAFRRVRRDSWRSRSFESCARCCAAGRGAPIGEAISSVATKTSRHEAPARCAAFRQRSEC